MVNNKSLPAEESSKMNTKTIQPKYFREAYKLFKTRYDQQIKIYITQSYVQ